MNEKELKNKLYDALAKGIAHNFDNKKKEEIWTNAEIGKYGISAISIVDEYLFPIIKQAINSGYNAGINDERCDTRRY